MPAAFLTIKGNPVTKKNSPQIVWAKSKAGKRYPMPIPSKPYLKWIEAAGFQVPAEMRKNTIATDVAVSAVIYRKKRIGDLDNYLAAVGDMLQKTKVIKNDRQIVSWDGSRLDHDKENPRIEIMIMVSQ